MVKNIGSKAKMPKSESQLSLISWINSYVTMDKIFNLPVPQFLILQNGDYNTCFINSLDKKT